MTQGPNSRPERSALDIITELATTLASSSPTLLRAVSESFAISKAERDPQPVTPVTAGQQRTYLVEMTLSDSALKVFIAAAGQAQIRASQLMRPQALGLFRDVDIDSALSELRMLGLVHRVVTDGQVAYPVTAAGENVFSDMVEDGIAAEYRPYLNLTTML